jgi:superfamily I DNA and/or RNA helicase
VITPYAQQRVLIMGNTNWGAQLGEGVPELAAGVEVKTVDGFQGREKEVIVFDTVRSNLDGRIGFLQVIGESSLAKPCI